jgi:hypothetical protein
MLGHGRVSDSTDEPTAAAVERGDLEWSWRI